MKSFIYTSLQTEPTSADRRAFDGRYPLKTTVAQKLLTIGEYFFGCIFLSIGIPLLGFDLVSGVITTLFGLGAVGAAVGERIWTVRKRTNSVRQDLFASENGLLYDNYRFYAEAIPKDDKKYQGTLFHSGQTSWITDSVSDPDSNFEIGSFDATKLPGGGEYAGRFRYGYAIIPLTKTLASRAILDRAQFGLEILNESTTGWGLANATIQTFGTRRALRPEFAVDYDLFVNDDARADALSIFTPELLKLLSSGSEKWYAEIIGAQLYIYKKYNFKAGDKATLQKIEAIVTQAHVTNHSASIVTDGNDVAPVKVHRKTRKALLLLSMWGIVAIIFLVLWVIFGLLS